MSATTSVASPSTRTPISILMLSLSRLGAASHNSSTVAGRSAAITGPNGCSIGERELSALMTSIRELAQVRDVGPLLQKLVDRAHELMGTDLTYLSEYDEATDELFVRATSGAVSVNMRGLRVPAGIGLASQIVKSRSAHWTSEYDVDAFPRDTQVTAAVVAESMRSILGVPLVSSDRVLGVLFAADRSRQTFSPDQIALLSAFADHGAVILQTARLLASERDIAARAASATAEAESRAAAMEALAAFHERLTQLVLTREEPAAIATALSVAIGVSVALADRQFEPWATAGDEASSWWRGGALPRGVIEAIQRSTRTARWVQVKGRVRPVSSRPWPAAPCSGPSWSVVRWTTSSNGPWNGLRRSMPCSPCSVRLSPTPRSGCAVSWSQTWCRGAGMSQSWRAGRPSGTSI